ncbi:glycoside hydrolase family 140 protein [candidate division KSB1 bacterium]|nr:glycoside hydrolase family 140 protein [candidate division KSB1 bacterium]
MKISTVTYYKKIIFEIFIITFLISLTILLENASAIQKLKVSPNKRFLIYEDGRPFFYLGDTAWELFHRLNREEADFYLKDRSKKGFTVIQAVVLAELDGLHVPNPYGNRPLIDDDPTRPDEAYFQHVDYIVNRAEKLGIFIGMLPTWGDKYNKRWGVGPEIFTPQNAKIFGEFLGKRYRNKPIIWILGGDRIPENENHFLIIRAMAAGLRAGDQGEHLMTFHPMGGNSSSKFFHEDNWLDFNMFQSGHAAYNIANYEMTLQDYALQPVKPVLDGEPRYEDHPVNWKSENGWFDDWDVRQAAYWSMLSGAAGHTYGNHNIWQMWQPGRQPISSARTPWKDAVKHIGSIQMGHFRQLFESRPFQKLIPDQTMLKDESGNDAAQIRIARADDYSFLIAYTPMGIPIQLDMTRFKSSNLIAYWFNPRTGKSSKIGRFTNQNSHEFIPMMNGRGNDWVLVIDEIEKKFPVPGRILKK